ELEKKVSSTGPYGLGDTITYAFELKNSGDVALSGVTVLDALAGLSPVTCPSTTLAAGAAMTCTASYTVAAADVAAGNVHNSATAQGTPPATPGTPAPPAVTTPPSQTDTPIVQAPALELEKKVSSTGPYGLGDTITYAFELKNSGDVALSGVTVLDALAGLSPVTCPSTTLAAGAAMTCTASYTVAAADVAAGNVHNSATAQGTPPATPGNPAPPAVTTPPSQTDTPIVQAPALELEKKVSSTGPYGLGDTITYAFELKNSGDVALSGVTVLDALAGLSPVTCPSTTLAAGAAMTCTASYTVAAADVAAGNVHNSATAQGTPPATPGNPAPPAVTTPPSQTDTPIVQAPALELEKTVSSTGPYGLGDTITYAFELKNSGDVALSGVTVLDALAGLSPVTCPSTTLAAGAAMTCTASYTVAAADVAAGNVHNSATAQGTPPATPGTPAPPAVTTPPSQTDTPIVQAPALELEKTVSSTGPYGLGDTITYAFELKNSGDVALSGVTVLDALAGLSPVTCPSTTLAAG
ncbi:DUF7507 domain-containing protein, partial [Stenotrophomonas mori]